jgi:hypothetical protein
LRWVGVCWIRQNKQCSTPIWCYILIKMAILWVLVKRTILYHHSPTYRVTNIMSKVTVITASVDWIVQNINSSTLLCLILIKKALWWIWIVWIKINKYHTTTFISFVKIERTIWWLWVLWIIPNTYSTSIFISSVIIKTTILWIFITWIYMNI